METNEFPRDPITNRTLQVGEYEQQTRVLSICKREWENRKEEKETLPDGVEPSTLRLTAARSNQLSYGRSVCTVILVLLLLGIRKEHDSIKDTCV